MEYFKEVSDNIFYIRPMLVNREDKESLKYAVGANLYMNGLMDLYKKISEGMSFVGSITICFEDAIAESDVAECESNTLVFLNKLYQENLLGKLDTSKIPLIFIRVRNIKQFDNFVSRLTSCEAAFLTGFTLPKFCEENGKMFLDIVRKTNQRLNKKIYVMPILESDSIIYKESRIETLAKLRGLIVDNNDIVLNVRVGGTDFSAVYGLRRSVYSSIYDIRVVSDCLADILNIFGCEGLGVVISGPVWEYFSSEYHSLEVQGLIKEILQDKENGFHGKTSIHPTQVKYINLAYIVTYEEYMDASNILNSSSGSGVFKGEDGNKMNEVKPHLNWAKRIVNRANVFGVLNKGVTLEQLYTLY